MRKNLIFILFTMFSGIYLSCGRDTVFNQYQPVQHKIWDKQSEYFFTFRISDNNIPYNIFIQVRNNSLYPYQNLWLFCEEKRPDGVSVRDTTEFMLADDFGKWTGNGITLFQNSFLYKQACLFPDTGQYTIAIRQGMREDELKGIEDIGLVIKKIAL